MREIGREREKEGLCVCVWVCTHARLWGSGKGRDRVRYVPCIIKLGSVFL